MASVIDLGLPWAVDNGAYAGFDKDRFIWLCGRLNQYQPKELMWVACPDVVGDCKATGEKFIEWEGILRKCGLPIAFVAQDGQEHRHLHWSKFDALFIGGTTDWKLGDGACELMKQAKREKKLVHMGRVNSLCRMELAFHSGVDSLDGTSMSKFGDRYIQRNCDYSEDLKTKGSLFRPT